MAEAQEKTVAEPYYCEHCDDSVPHTHVDEQPLVERYRRDLMRAVLAVAAVGVIGLAVVLVLAMDAAFGLVLGLAAWAVATIVGLIVFLALRRARTTPVAVIGGAIATAAVSPILALVAAYLAPGTIGARALAAGLGWLAVSALVTAVRTGRLRDQLVAHTRDGEAARSAIVRTGGRPSPYIETGWLVLTALVFGLCVAATALMPVLTGVLVPLNTVLAVLTRRLQAAATQPRAAS